MDMQAKLQAALAPRGGQMASTQTMPEQAGFPMSGPAQDGGMEQRWRDVVGQLQAVIQEMEVTEDPQQLQQLAQVAEQLQMVLEEEYGGQLPPDMAQGNPGGGQGFPQGPPMGGGFGY